MISNPYLPSPTRAAAWAEGFLKGMMAISSPSPSATVGPDDVDAFNEGVLAGVSAQTDGLSLANECVASSDSTEDSETLKHTFEGLDGVAEVIGGAMVHGLAGGLEGGVVAFCLFLISAPVAAQPPEQALPSLGQPLADALASMGVGSIELFCGAGIDATQHDCEYRLTPLFLSQEQARSAVQAMGRQNWVIVSWRTDQSNSFKIVDSA